MSENLPRRGPGRPSKGKRTTLKGLVSPAVKTIADERARERGLTTTDYLIALIAADAGMPQLMEPYQEETQLQKSA